MPIKKDGTGKRWVEMEVLVPGTPEQVWQAMATGDGNAAWFTKATIEERVGGKLEFDFGPDMSSSGEVTIWEPPHRFGYVERDWSKDAPPVATEIVITSRSGDQCLVRMVHSLFTSSDDWDDQMEGFEGGWPGFFEVLRIYLGHFAGKKAVSARVMAFTKSDQLAVWSRLTHELGLAGLNAGERRTTSAQPERMTGVVHAVHQDDQKRYALLRLDEPAGVAMFGTYGISDNVNVSAIIFFYGDDAAEKAQASEDLWRDWLGKTFPSAA
ncbi:SRPBCC family protein [Hyphomicrobium sp.]|uniref:SRPBCC family protein n=1 Tax=Hyphomicrobium sp. TaxID=82 RepID=UPI003F702790